MRPTLTATAIKEMNKVSDTISEAAKLKACELASELAGGNGYAVEKMFLPNGLWDSRLHALARFIQQVSDAAKGVCRTLDLAMPTKLAADEEKKALAPFILPDPVDPLLARMIDVLLTDEANDFGDEPGLMRAIETALAKANLKIVQADQ